MSPIEIDGSHGEGGGQLARLAMALAAITGRPLHLTNIRAGRAKPGLMPQHLAALRAVAAVSQGELSGAELGARAIRFAPGRIRGGDYRFEVGTAGSVSLVLQALLPVALHADGPCRLCIAGGTDVKMAPPLDYLRLIFLPWLARLGVSVQIESLRRGYYPRGGGELCLKLAPRKQLQPLVLETAGPVRAIRGVAHVAHLPLSIAERMANAAGALLTDLGPVALEAKVLGQDEAFGTGGALVLAAETEHSLLGAACVAERGVPAERLGEAAGLALRAELQSGAAFDGHAADQLLIYLAQAPGSSRFTVREPSLHARTVMWLIEQFLPVRFKLTAQGTHYRIELVHG
ncbi:MAG: RNA 3'-terminal phosphate cyclase [Pseudomonadota bacterium]